MGGRVVEGTGLENRQTFTRLEGSNPSPSANNNRNPLFLKCFNEDDPDGPNSGPIHILEAMIN
jgi:hypothetical protein